MELCAILIATYTSRYKVITPGTYVRGILCLFRLLRPVWNKTNAHGRDAQQRFVRQCEPPTKTIPYRLLNGATRTYKSNVLNKHGHALLGLLKEERQLITFASSYCNRSIRSTLFLRRPMRRGQHHRTLHIFFFFIKRANTHTKRGACMKWFSQKYVFALLRRHYCHRGGVLIKYVHTFKYNLV